MDDHAGAGCILSVLIVVVFTLIFHDVERPAGPRRAGTASPANSPSFNEPTKVGAPSAAAIERSAPAEPAVAIEPSKPAPVAAPSLKPPSVAPATPHGVVAASTVAFVGLSRPSDAELAAPSDPPSRAGASSKPPRPIEASTRPSPPAPAIATRTKPRRPGASTTIILDGERLADVAIRIYGTPEAAATLWRANRDRLKGVDGPVSAGLLIRTP